MLSVTSFLVGGGVAQVPLFLLNWVAATRIRGDLSFWRRALPRPARGALRGVWRVSLTMVVLLFLAAIEVAVIGYVPGVSEPARLLHICWGMLGGAVGLLLLTYVSGFAHDLEARGSVRGSSRSQGDA
jgi:hypothetical protein